MIATLSFFSADEPLGKPVYISDGYEETILHNKIKEIPFPNPFFSISSPAPTQRRAPAVHRITVSRDPTAM